MTRPQPSHVRIALSEAAVGQYGISRHAFGDMALIAGLATDEDAVASLLALEPGPQDSAARITQSEASGAFDEICSGRAVPVLARLETHEGKFLCYLAGAMTDATHSLFLFTRPVAGAIQAGQLSFGLASILETTMHASAPLSAWVEAIPLLRHLARPGGAAGARFTGETI